MFTFTKKADYALLALSFLSTEGRGRLVGPREIAGRYEIPPELLAKVMQTLARHRLVASVPGPTGGYKISRPPAEISVADVVQAVDGPLAIAQCWEVGVGMDGCAQARHCTLRGPLARIQEEMIRLLQEMTVEEVCRPAAPSPFPIGRAFDSGLALKVLDAVAVPGRPVPIAEDRGAQ